MITAAVLKHFGALLVNAFETGVIHSFTFTMFSAARASNERVENGLAVECK